MANENQQPCGACRQSQLLFPFTMAFQPIVDVRERRIIAYEALVRGLNGESAAQVLAKVDASNRYAFDQACRVKAIELASRLGVNCELSINFLPNAVYDPSACIRATLAAAERTGFPLRHLTFEIVEHEDVVEIGHLRKIIGEYKFQGFKVALDDFGTSYSGLHRLAELQPDIVKLDRALIMNCDEDRTRLTIIASVVRLCRDLNIRLVIEGVESAAEFAALKTAGARFMQGFYFATPSFEGVVSDDAIKWPRPATTRRTQPDRK